MIVNLVSSTKDVAVTCGFGPPLSTSCLLLAAASPWLGRLLAGAGEDPSLLLPSLSADQLSSYLSALITPGPGSAGALELQQVHDLITPQHWKQQSAEHKTPLNFKIKDESRTRESLSVKVEVLECEDSLDNIAFDTYNSHKDNVEEQYLQSKNPKKKRQRKTLENKLEPRERDSEEGQTIKILGRSRGRPRENESDSSGDEWCDTRTKHILKDKKSQPCGNISEFECPVCGVSVEKDGSENGGLVYEKHQMKHKVQNFSCQCTEWKDIVSNKKEVTINKFKNLKERHIKVRHMSYHGCHICHRSYETEHMLVSHIKIHIRNQKAQMKLTNTENKLENKVHRKKRRKQCGAKVDWPEDLLCPDCGENIGRLGGKDRGAAILRHQLRHQVDSTESASSPQKKFALVCYEKFTLYHFCS